MIDKLTNEEIKTQLPSLVGVTSNNLPAEVIERAVDNLKLDSKLGLESQSVFDAAELLNKDIENLIGTTEYEEVTKADIENLFSIPSMKRQTYMFNLFHKYKYAAGCIAMFLVLAFCTTTFGKYLAGLHLSIGVATIAWIGVVAMGIGVIASAIHAVYYLDESQIPSHPQINVSLKVEDISKTSIKIPYGAKLRLEEAFDKKMFDGFYVCRPDVTYEQVTPKPKVVDPAIIGVKRNRIAKTEKWYMIVFWDIPMDIDATEKRIKQLKRFKLT